MQTLDGLTITPQYKSSEKNLYLCGPVLTESSSPVREGFRPKKNSKVADHLNHNTSRIHQKKLSYFAGNRSHALPLFVSANVLPLNMLYFETVCSLMHDISTNSAPQNICDLFTCSSDVHSYNTRLSDAGNLYVNKSRLNCGIA